MVELPILLLHARSWESLDENQLQRLHDLGLGHLAKRHTMRKQLRFVNGGTINCTK